jgi:glycosyltransferase involved in cell wall biosynthesis
VKGVLELLEALALVPLSLDWQLIVAGRDPHPGAPYEARCRDAVGRLGLADRVKFIGFVEKVDDFYEAIDLAIVPSLEEPLGRIPLEAASYRRPSIASAIGGLPETVVEGETGWLVPAANAEAMRDAITYALMQADLELMGRQARIWVAKTCDPAEYGRALAALYRRLVAMV